MQPVQLQSTYLDLTTPHVADACMRLGIPVRYAPAGTRPLWSGTHLVGRVCPARHYGSVDVFLEAIEGSDPGDVLVVDNSGRSDEACVGDFGDFGGEPRRPVWHRDLGPAPRHDRTSNHPVACLQLGSIARRTKTP